jgi:hypothetical protein
LRQLNKDYNHYESLRIYESNSLAQQTQIRTFV